MSPQDEASALPPPESGPDLAARVVALERQVAELQQRLDVGSAREAVARVGTQRPVPSPVSAVHREQAPAAPAATPQKRSLESDLGSKVLSKVGVLLLLAGAAWFLKWAYDNAWIGATGRVLVGLAAGAGIILWSERFRRTGTPAFSYALKAVGSGVLYLSLWASFQLYHLVPSTVALLLMIAVTAWNAALALSQDSRLLAGYALAGAYLTPVLLSTGGNHEVFLFVYLASIAAAVLALLSLRRWNLLLLAPLPVTTAFFIAWYAVHYTAAEESVTLVLALLLWALFAAVPLVARESTDLLGGVLQPLGAAIFGALTVYSVLADSGGRALEPWAACAFAAAYLALSFLKRGTVVAAIHLSLGVTFLTIAIPLKLTGCAITIAWLAESLALLWLARSAEMDDRARAALQWLGCAAMLLGAFGALFDLTLQTPAATPFANRDFATAVAALVVLAAAALLTRRLNTGPVMIAPVAFLLFNIVLLYAMQRQIEFALHGEAADFAFSATIATQGALMLGLGFWQRESLARWTGLVLLGVTLLKTVAYDLRNVGTGYRVVSYLALGVILMAVSFAYQKDWLSLRDDLPTQEPRS